MVRSSLVVLSALATRVVAWPNLLECTNDSFNRLTEHQKIMGGPVKACEEGSCPSTITVAPGEDGTTIVSVTTNAVGLFAIRVNEGVGSLSSNNAKLKNTMDCERQMITDTGIPTPQQPGTFEVIFTPEDGKSLDDAVFTVGFASGAALPGVADGVVVLTYPPTPPAPAPAPKPVGTPMMTFDPTATCGDEIVTLIHEQQTFDLQIAVVGDQGFEHSCSSSYDPKLGVADKDCIDWLPQSVVDRKEGLDISLTGRTSAGKLAACMRWKLSFEGEAGTSDAWQAPDGGMPSMHQIMNSETMRDFVAKLPEQPQFGNNTRENRQNSMYNYLDAMSYMSHRCVPAGEPRYFEIPLDIIPDFAIAFPPNVLSEVQLRLSHVLLASTGMVWSIDRQCLDAWYIDSTSPRWPTPGGDWHESCVPSLASFPHCHVNCKSTWQLGPGGVATWGIFSMTHHIPAPNIALVTQGFMEEAEYGNKGCGDVSRAALSV